MYCGMSNARDSFGRLCGALSVVCGVSLEALFLLRRIVRRRRGDHSFDGVGESVEFAAYGGEVLAAERVTLDNTIECCGVCAEQPVRARAHSRSHGGVCAEQPHKGCEHIAGVTGVLPRAKAREQRKNAPLRRKKSADDAKAEGLIFKKVAASAVAALRAALDRERAAVAASFEERVDGFLIEDVRWAGADIE